MNRRLFAQTAAVAAVLVPCLAPSFLRAQTRPSDGPALETARILTGFPAGGTVDVLARRVADKIRGVYANNVLVENKPGAAGQLGVITLKDGAADGSVMLLTPSSMLSIYPFTYPKLQYRLDDVTPVSNGAWINHALAVGPGVPESVKSLKAFLDWARANPDKANFGSPGAGSMPHIIGIMLEKQSKAGLKHIPYRGSVPGVQDLLGSQISAFCGPIGDFLPHAKAGNLRILAASGDKRSRFAPDTATFREQGVPVSVREWYGFMMPAKAPSSMVRRAAQAIAAALKHPDVAASAENFGLDLQASSPSELSELVKADADQWRVIIKQLGFTAES